VIQNLVIVTDSYPCRCLAQTDRKFKATIQWVKDGVVRSEMWWITIACISCGAKMEGPVDLLLINANNVGEDEKSLMTVVTEARRKIEP
jgi:hypothetical protein